MAVADPSWWGVWWLWLLIWGITVVSLLAVVAKVALRQEVQERITSSREGEVSAALALLKARGKQGVNREVFRSYIEEAEPITVIGIGIDVLDRADDIVDVDLLKQEVTANRALPGSPLCPSRERAAAHPGVG